VHVSNLTNVQAIALGEEHACAIVAGGAVFCWGDNAFGELGQPAATMFSDVPVQVAGIQNATSIAAGQYHTCVVRTGGTVSCWGRNNATQVGPHGFAESSCARDVCYVAPFSQSTVTNVVEVGGGISATCARESNGTVVCWGENGLGQLGDGNLGVAASPMTVKGLP
jgi:alpha-tubulin suppressor-like RCC1 family protein